MTSLADVFVQGRVDTSRFGPDIKSGLSSSSVRSATSTSGKTLGGHFKSGFGGALRGIAAPLTAALGAVAVGSFLKGSIDEATEAAKVSARTAGVIKSTGGAAHITAKQIGDLSTAISNKTAIDDEAIQSGANLLLTFKNIRDESGKGNDIFKQATQTVTDLSVGMGQSLKSSAVQVGKALNDPIKGITALSRVGVTFDAQQKKQIERFTEAGRTMAAQKIILKELNSEFGGAAESAATPAEKAQVAWGNFKEQVGTALLPVLGKLATWFTTTALPAISKFATYIQTVVVPAISHFVGMVVDWFHQADESSGGFRDGIENLKDRIVEFVNAAIPVVKSIIAYFVSMWPQIKPTIDAFVEGLKSAFEFAQTLIETWVKVITFVWQHFGETIVKYLKATFENVIAVLKGVFKVIGGLFDFFSDLLKGNWGDLWDDVKQIVSGVWDIIKGLVKQALAVIRGFFSVAKTILAGIWRAMWDAIKAAAANAWDAIKRDVQGLLDDIYGIFRDSKDLLLASWNYLWDTAKDVTSNAMDTVWQTIRNAFADIIDIALGFGETFLGLADKAFGWIPGLGGKLDDAKQGFADFRDDVNAYLRGIDDQRVTVTGSFSVPSQAQITKVTDQLGGLIPAATGGLFTGGVPGKDSIHALVMPGEYINRTIAVAREGVDKFHMLNQGKASIVPHFKDGGLVVDTLTSSSGARATASIADRIMSRISALLGVGLSRALDGIVGDLRPPVLPGGGGTLPPGVPIEGALGRGVQWMQGQIGKPYLWGGVGPSGYDCSGLMSALTNVLRGASNPYFRLGATASMPWPGFLPGAGNFSVGWTTNYGGSGIGHTAGTLSGLNVESAGGVGVRQGSAARSAWDAGFTNIMHLAGFDTGGLARGAGWFPKGPAPERILNDRQTVAFENALDRNFGAAGGATTINVYDVNNQLIGTMRGMVDRGVAANNARAYARGVAR